jgi:hypothetical protein
MMPRLVLREKGQRPRQVHDRVNGGFDVGHHVIVDSQKRGKRAVNAGIGRGIFYQVRRKIDWGQGHGRLCSDPGGGALLQYGPVAVHNAGRRIEPANLVLHGPVVTKIQARVPRQRNTVTYQKAHSRQNPARSVLIQRSPQGSGSLLILP